ncbi:MAG: class IV adenylate cyclase [Candidatus Saccharimonas sp.]
MKPEIEVKFTDVDIADVRRRLKKAGAVCHHAMRDMRRALIEEPHHADQNMFIRIRDEGDRVTLCLKKKTKSLKESTINSTFEIETTIGDFEAAVELFRVAGWEYVTYQESRRETWQLGEVEVVIDEWPWLNPYIEIEGESEVVVRTAAKTLGFNWGAAMFGSVDVLYNRDYPHMTVRGVIDIKEVRFADPVPREFVP